MKRRTRGSGSIRQRSKGSWQVRYEGPPDTEGERKLLSETVRGSRRDAEKVLRQHLGVIEDGGYVAKAKETVAEFMQHWLKTYAASNTTPRTQQGYRGNVSRYIAPAIGNIPLQSLRPQHIQGMYGDMLDRDLSARTVLHVHRVLRQALSHAVKWGLIVRNPADAATAPRPERAEMEMWGVETIHRFLEAAVASPFYKIYHLDVLTGLRRSELLGLHWDNIDLDAGSLMVVKTLQRIYGRGLVEGQPKTAKSRRSIALSSTAVTVLRSVRVTQLEQRMAVGPVWNDTGYAFTQPDGRPIDPDAVTHDFQSVVRRAELPHLTFHGLRHAHATLMLTAGVHPKIVSERLGHSNISITMDIYSHVMPGMQEAAAQAVDERLATGGPDELDLSTNVH